jgi:hypothetical protein
MITCCILSTVRPHLLKPGWICYPNSKVLGLAHVCGVGKAEQHDQGEGSASADLHGSSVKIAAITEL